MKTNDKKSYQKERYHRLKEEGLCVDCGFRKPIKDRTRCKICTDLLRERQIDSRLRKQEEGRCTQCGVKHHELTLTCKKCTDKNRERMKKYYKGNKKCK